MKYDMSIGSVSWIDGTYLPDISGLNVLGAESKSQWIFKTYYGLSATANPPPPDTVTEFRDFERRRNFRALMFFHCKATIDEKSGKITELKVLDATHNAGFTPPFSFTRNPGGLILPVALKSLVSRHHSPGTASTLSVIRGQNRHPNSAIQINSSETVLANGVIKFRAGKETDDIGVQEAKAEYHVPWVWCEIALTVSPVLNAPPQFTLYGRGSVFPSHAWYVNGRQVMTQIQAYDITVPKNASVSNTKIGPVLSKGALASGPQVGSTEGKLTGPVQTHAYTVHGGETLRRVVSFASSSVMRQQAKRDL